MLRKKKWLEHFSMMFLFILALDFMWSFQCSTWTAKIPCFSKSKEVYKLPLDMLLNALGFLTNPLYSLLNFVDAVNIV